MVRGDMLGHAIEQVGQGPVRRLGPDLWPEPGEDIVGASPQQQFERLAEQGLHGLAEGLVGQGRDPATKGEAAAGVFFRPARGLHDAVEGDEGGDDELAHGVNLLGCVLDSRTGLARIDSSAER